MVICADVDVLARVQTLDGDVLELQRLPRPEAVSSPVHFAALSTARDPIPRP